MSDRRKTTPTTAPPRFDADLPLRETYARQLRLEDRPTLATFCESMLELTFESTIFADRIAFGGPCDHVSAVAAEVSRGSRKKRQGGQRSLPTDHGRR